MVICRWFLIIHIDFINVPVYPTFNDPNTYLYLHSSTEHHVFVLQQHPEYIFVDINLQFFVFWSVIRRSQII